MTKMKSFKKALLYGFLVWLVPFVVSVLIFPIKTSLPALFESIMPIVVAICVVIFSILYFRKPGAELLKEGILLGVTWLAISITLDLLLFMEGPMKMSFTGYMMDIGLTYLIIPTITIGFGYLLEKSRR